MTSIEAKHTPAAQELNELSEKLELISTKVLTKNLINGCSFLNGAKYSYGEDGSKIISYFNQWYIILSYFKYTRKDSIILGKRRREILDDITLTAEVEYSYQKRK